MQGNALETIIKADTKWKFGYESTPLNWKYFARTRQIIRYPATATLRRPHIIYNVSLNWTMMKISSNKDTLIFFVVRPSSRKYSITIHNYSTVILHFIQLHLLNCRIGVKYLKSGDGESVKKGVFVIFYFAFYFYFLFRLEKNILITQSGILLLGLEYGQFGPSLWTGNTGSFFDKTSRKNT